MGEQAEKKKGPGRPKKNKDDVLADARATIKKLTAENEQLAKFAMDDLDGTVQFRESTGVLRLMGIKARSKDMSVNQWVRHVAREKVGL